MAWQQTYREYLRASDYNEEEVGTFVAEASRVVLGVPEPYKTRLLKQLDGATRDDFDNVDFRLIATLFEPDSPFTYTTYLHSR